MSKIKTIFLVFLSGFVGIVSNPEMLTASDSVALNGLNPAGIVETVPLPEPEPEPVVEEVADTGYSYTEPVYVAPVYVAPVNYIQINGLTIPLVYTVNSDENAYAAMQAWYYTSGKWIYGHNYDYVFGFLDTAYDQDWLKGITFTVSMNGSINTYTVTDYRMYDYINETTLRSRDTDYGLLPITNANLDGVYHKMAIMTCYAGKTKRLVVYAD